jgi:hypothetical protein
MFSESSAPYGDRVITVGKDYLTGALQTHHTQGIPADGEIVSDLCFLQCAY